MTRLKITNCAVNEIPGEKFKEATAKKRQKQFFQVEKCVNLI